MDSVITAPVEGQSAEAQPGAKQEWIAPALKKLDLAETRESLGSGGDLVLESGPADG